MQEGLIFKFVFNGKDYTFEVYPDRCEPYEILEKELTKKYPNARIVFPKACECIDEEYYYYTGEMEECTCVASEWNVKIGGEIVPLLFTKKSKKGYFQPYAQVYKE